jgi:hypothetical protein
MTNPRFKDFGSGGYNVETQNPLSFKLYGEDFHCVPTIQGALLLDLVKKGNSEDPVVQSETINEFFASVLKDESLERFNALVADKEKIVTVDALSEIIGWLIEEYSGRPEEQPEA